ncbi:polymorphic toxin-type HINT domain-containing protein [Streptomyces sp. NBC_01014]|uniref:polymorphic toxin-type HINT domain-containing protein n=1 Tax=Streptomyces sp. NBC_01014 TaxID=2903719 RepID=UPI00386D9C5D|nr:polymorphic toxin-type HINT domain-containing protein [Streptomyces sp. NBC_01014]
MVAAPATKNGTAVPFKAKTAAAKDPAKTAARRTSDLEKRPVTWPKAAAATLTSSSTGSSDGSSVGDLPLKVSPPVATKTRSASTAPAAKSVSVHVADRKAAEAAGVHGAVVSLARSDGGSAAARNKLTLGYAGFAHAYGGDYGSRLSLVSLPQCSLTTPTLAKCRTQTPVATDNDVEKQTLTATVPVAAKSSMSVLAATAAPTSGAGSYTATSLNPSAAWSAGGASGDFTWSYPIGAPPASGGPMPNLSINYSAQSVDGRLPSTNNQSSWVGEGFDLTSSYIERSYASCDDDGEKGKHDECWDGDNAELVLGGKSTPLIKSKTGEWHPKDDDGERIVHSTGATNGDDDGEYWTVTTQDGTSYVFGENRLPGWSTGAAETNSTWTVPVYGNNADEFCHGKDFASSSCTQAWRWNLDYVVDAHGGAMSYWYTPETNYYAKNGGSKADTEYTRGGVLKRIDYGFTSASAYGTAASQVLFSTAERCLTTSTETCSSLTSAAAKDWPDVPYDQICASGATCSVNSPTFFSRKRLTGISTQVWDASLSKPAYRPVDSWALDQSFLDPGDGTSAGLWLKSITRTGEDGSKVAMPPVTFTGVQLYNRVDTTHDNIAALVKWRVRTVTSETGSVVTVNYSDPECVAGKTMPSAPDADTMRCFPTYWQPPYTDAPQLDWFHKYVVTQVNESDPTGGAPLQETDYTYGGSPAWHYDSDNTTTPAARKTWSQWRGYGSVTTTTGNSQSTRTKSTATYFRGMDGDKQSDGTTRSAKITDSTGTAVTDADALAGQVRESITYNGSAEVGGTITDQWIHTTADDGTRQATFTRPAAVHTRTDLASGGARVSTVRTTYDASTGAVTAVDDQGDDAASGDEQCTRTTYANNSEAWLMDAPIRVETVDVGCDATPSRPDDVISDVRSLYDNQPYGTAPTAGDETSTQRLTSYSGTTPQYQTVSTSTYDSQGRVLSVTDAGQHSTSTVYTPTTGGPLTKTVTTDAKHFNTTTTYDPARGLAVDVVDANNKRTDYAYDGLGRLTSLWLPNRSQSSKQSASMVYTYSISKTDASAVTTGTLKNDGASYNYIYTVYDAMLRPRQTQTPAPGGGRVIAETKYDSRGISVESDADYTDGTAPHGKLDTITSAVPSQTLTTYDGAGRATDATFYANGTKKWSSSTAYGGDRTTVTPPKGGIATTTLTDTDGRTTETRQYDSGKPSGTYSSIKYTYDAKSRLSEVHDTDGNTWSYTYDLMGRKILSTDPDAGKTKTVYDDLDQVSSTTDSRDKTLSYTYDELGRKTGMYDGLVQDPDHQLAQWTFDSIAKGQPSSSVRYVGGSGSSGKAYISQVATYDSLYRPTAARVVIPSVPGEEALAGTYTSSTGYNLDGTVQVTSDPAAGDLPSESMTYGYNELGMPTTLSGKTGYVQKTTYTKQSDLSQLTLGVSSSDSAKWLQVTNKYEDGTRRLTDQLVTGDVTTAPVQDTSYTYDDAGNPTKIATHSSAGDDVQCFRYDGHARLTQAWTATDACASDPSAAVLGGPAAYWQSYTYDDLGNRTKQVDHATTGPVTGPAGPDDRTTDYTYPAAKATQPHTLSSSTTTNADGSTTDDSYTYDQSGNTTARTLGGKKQTLDWDDEGHLAKVTNADGTSVSYLYDADGNRLLSRDTKGTTLFLGDTEIRLTKADGSTAATRYYAWAGQTIAARTSKGLEWQFSDGHGTAEAQVDSTTQEVSFRRMDPFGNPRGQQPSTGAWFGDKGFVGGIQDTTSDLTHLGAREYDPTIGRFVSLDPVLELSDPQQINGYTYASDNPVGGSDPTGLKTMESNGGGGYDSATSRTCAGSSHSASCAGNNWSNNSGGGTYTGGGGGLAGGGGGGGGGSTHHSCGWSISCHYHSEVHKAYHFVQKHPVMAAVVATAVVAGAVACVVATAGGCAAVLLAGAEGAAVGAEFGADAAVVSGALGVIGEGGGVVVGAAATAGSGTAAIAEGVKTASAEEAGTSAGARAASSASEDTAASGAAKGGERAAKAAPKSGASPKCSFTPSTPVLMKGGKTKPIGKIKAGDKVEAADPDTGKHKGPRTVQVRWVNHDNDLIDLTIRKKDGSTSVLHTTSKHPYWDDTTHTWVPAGHLALGHALNTADDKHVFVAAVDIRAGAADMYNLTVEQLHTYYVLAGATPVLVHNCNGKLADLPVHERPTRFYAKASEMLDRIQGNPATREQMYGSADAGHGGVTSLSNDDLIRFGGPNGREPITGFRDFAPGDDINLPGSRLHIADGNNRTEEIRNRVLDGRMHPDTLIEMMIGGN